MNGPQPTGKSGLVSLAIRLLVLAGIVAGIAGLIYSFGGSLTLESLAAREVQLRELYKAHPVVTLTIAFLLYVAVTGLSIPGSVPLSLSYGWLFGFGPAVVLVSFASTTGASIAFAMECFENGVITKEQTGGLELKFGNTDAMIQALYMMVKGEGEFGKTDRRATGETRSIQQRVHEPARPPSADGAVLELHGGGREMGSAR